jgi:glycosyltransferase involved in cell wall biosynthesis
MPKPPRISVVTPSYNQGRFLGRTIDSVLAQGYPELEHIVVDGMSTDDTSQVLARYPHLRVLREPDDGQADAINKGFQLATGEILCFLNSDDTFLPGALQRVAREIDPARGRHIVMGRCIYIDENDIPTGLEVPSAYEGHLRILEVWKTHCVPQPATFWTAEAWRRCGPIDKRVQLVPDYDLMCRFSRSYRFHEIDQVLATYRLHAASKSCANTEHDIIENAIRVSRSYWGSPLGLRYWLLRASLTQHRSQWRRARLQKALDHWAGARGALAGGHRLKAAVLWLLGVGLAPRVAARRFVAVHGIGAGRRPESPLTRAWRSFTGAHDDGMAAPDFRTTIMLRPEHATLRLEGRRVLPWLPLATHLQVSIDDEVATHYQALEPGLFTINITLANLTPGPHRLRIISAPTVVPDDYTGLGDLRPLGFKLERLLLEERSAAAEPLIERRLAAG